MITKEMIDRINFLSRKSREESLSEEEKQEQAELRRKYIEHIKGQVRQQLESIEIVDKDDCSCGGHGKGHTHSHDHGKHSHDHGKHKHHKGCGCKSH